MTEDEFYTLPWEKRQKIWDKIRAVHAVIKRFDQEHQYLWLDECNCMKDVLGQMSYPPTRQDLA